MICRGTTEQSVPNRIEELKSLIFSENSNDFTWGLDALVDTLVVLHDECSNSTLRREKCISDFITLAHPFVQKIKQLRLSKNDFDLVKTIGRGAFGDVVLAKLRTSTEQEAFAVKILNKAEMLKRADTACFREERELLLKGDSKWVTRMHFAFQDFDNLYFVLDYYPGGDLLTLLSKFDDHFPESMARFYCAEIAEALQSIHSLGYIHRDVKPDNVLLDWNGHIRLGDFGSAIIIPKGSQTARVAVGTPDYISPEILQAMESGRGVYGTECDWWSLGCTLWEMLFGLPPFYANSLVETYGKIMRHVQKKLALEFPPDIDITEDCKEVLTKLLSPADERIGTKSGSAELQAHTFFKDICFHDIHQFPPPYVPHVTGVLDTSNFDVETIEQRRALGGVPSCKQSCQNNFDEVFSGTNLPFIGFTYLIPNQSITAIEDTTICASDERTIGIQTIEVNGKFSNTHDLQRTVLSNLENEHKIRDHLHKITVQMSKSVDQMQTQIVAVSEDKNKQQDQHKWWQQGRNVKACHMKVQEMEASLKQEQESKLIMQLELRQVKADNVAKCVRIESLTDTIEKLERQVQQSEDVIDDHVHKFIDTNFSMNEPNICILCRGLIWDNFSVGVCLYCDKLAHYPECGHAVDTVILKGVLGFSVPHRWNVERYLCVLTKKRFIIFSQNCQMHRVFDRRNILSACEQSRKEESISFSGWRTNSLREISNGSLKTQSSTHSLGVNGKMFRIVIDNPLRLSSPPLSECHFCLNCIVESEQQKQRWMKIICSSEDTCRENDFKIWRISNWQWKSVRCALIIDQSELWIGSEDTLWTLRLNKTNDPPMTAHLKKVQNRRTLQLDMLSPELIIVLSGRSRSVRILQRVAFDQNPTAKEVCKLTKNVNLFILTKSKLYLFARSKALIVFDVVTLKTNLANSTAVRPCLSIDLNLSDNFKCLNVHEDTQSSEAKIVIGYNGKFCWMTMQRSNDLESCAIDGDPLGSVMINRTVFLITSLYGYSDLANSSLRWPSQANNYALSDINLFVCCPVSGIHIYHCDEKSHVCWNQTISLLNSIPLNHNGSLFMSSMQLTPLSHPLKDEHKIHIVDLKPAPISSFQLNLIHIGQERLLFNNSSHDFTTNGPPDISPPSDFRHLTHIGKGAGQSIVQNIDSENKDLIYLNKPVNNTNSSRSSFTTHNTLVQYRNANTSHASITTDNRSIHSCPPPVQTTEDDSSSIISHFSN